MNSYDFLNLKTPSFILDPVEFDRGINTFENALKKYWPNYKIGYSVKTNQLPWLIKRINLLGHYIEVVSTDEYQLAQILGTDDKKIIYNGPIKTISTFFDALYEQSIVNIDSSRELDWIIEADKKLDEDKSKALYKIGIRVNFDLYEALGKEKNNNDFSRFGFSYENGDLKKVITRISNLNHYKISGLHCHFSTKDRAVKNYQMIARKIGEIAEEYSLSLDYVDIGGGFYGGLPNKPSFNQYLEVIAKELSQYFSPLNTSLIVEPGTSILSKPFKYISRVVDVKEIQGKTIVVIDGSRTDIDPLMSKSNYMLDFSSKSNSKTTINEQVIVGFTCMELDRITTLNDSVKLSVNDILVFNNIGAYTMCLSPNFIQYGTVVYFKENNQYRMIRDKIDINEYIKMNGGIK